MNDRFKFRIWHKPLKQMHYNDFIVTATGYMAKIYQQDDYMMKFNQEDLEFDKQCILMQCTGLKDKHGKLIYEGDVVRVYPFEYNGEIIFENYSYMLRANLTYLGVQKLSLVELEREKMNLEVIGNTYENPELLEEECQK